MLNDLKRAILANFDCRIIFLKRCILQTYVSYLVNFICPLNTLYDNKVCSIYIAYVIKFYLCKPFLPNVLFLAKGKVLKAVAHKRIEHKA